MVSHAVILTSRHPLESGPQMIARLVTRIRQTLEHLEALGVREVAVVDGRHAEQIRVQLGLHDFPGLHVRVLSNLPNKHESGSAVLAARTWIEHGKRCLVLHGDRPLSLETLGALVESARDMGSQFDASIVVSRPPHTVLAAGSEVRVRVESLHDSPLLHVRAIGEDLADTDVVFTRHALVTDAILGVLQALPNPTVEDGLLALVAAGRVRAVASSEWSWSARAAIDIEDKVTALLDAKRHNRYLLLNPGPVNTTATVKSALVHHDVCHRDSTFSDLMLSLTRKLRRIFRGSPEHSILMITGSGTAAMESALASTVPPDRKILIIDNGAFGERLVEVAAVHEMDVVHLRYDWGQLVDPADVERALAAHPEIAVVAMIHHETSVGLLNPVREIGALCRRHDALLVVDAVSSLGAEDIDVVRDNVDVCYSSANKCLHAVSGASFMCVSPRVWPRVEALKPRAYYLDLRRYRRYMDSLAQTPFTPAVSTYFALDAACNEFLADGHERRYALYAERNQLLRDGLEALDMPPFTRTGHESHSIVTCYMPKGVAFEDLYYAVKDRDIILYGCKGVLADKNCMQVANMGDLDNDKILHFLAVVAEELERLRGRSRKSAQRIAQVPREARRTG